MSWKIFDVSLGEETRKEINVLIETQLQSRNSRPVFLVTLNSEILLKAEKNEKYRAILNSADWKINDGVGLQVLAFLKNKKIGQRWAGADLAEKLLIEAREKDLKLGLAVNSEGLSHKEEVENFLRKQGNKNFSVFSQTRDIFLESADFPDNFKQTQILLVGLGAPWQEKFISRAMARNLFPNLKLAIGVGGTFDFWTGRQKRAPLFLRKIGLEWLWRLIFQPRRLKRIWRATVVFLWKGFLN